MIGEERFWATVKRGPTDIITLIIRYKGCKRLFFNSRGILPLGDPKYRITGDGPVIRMTGLNVEMKGRNIKAER